MNVLTILVWAIQALTNPEQTESAERDVFDSIFSEDERRRRGKLFKF